MNKNDRKLIFLVLGIVAVLFLGFSLFQKPSLTATIYHGNDILLTIDLTHDATYTVNGDLGEVVIEVKDKKIRVEKENSPYHLCSKQGFVSSTHEPIVCLPNRIIIEMNASDLDTQVK